MKNLMLLLFALVLSSTILVGQNIWKGGTPGQETSWDVAKNWSKNRVPDWTDDVIIVDVSSCSGVFPVIENEVEPIAHLEIYGNAKLTILRKGKLTIDGISTFDTGILLVGNLYVDGEFSIKNTAFDAIENLSGKPVVDRTKIACLKGKLTN